ncbi:MAG: transporter substrate-binding domain-containing protein [Alphaproteobacteria bacterium]|nr:transporter substrate-binding domain-containing protein [Alphaproteobacteria bacterium]
MAPKINSNEAVIPVIEGDISQAMAEARFPDAELFFLPQIATVSDMFMAVLSRKANVMFLDQAMVDGFEESNPGALRKAEGISAPFVFPTYYSVLSGEIRLRDMVDVALRKMIDDGRIETMARRYSEDYIPAAKNF